MPTLRDAGSGPATKASEVPSGFIVVADLARLALLGPSARVTDGVIAYVQSSRLYYQLDRLATDTPISPMSLAAPGGGLWHVTPLYHGTGTDISALWTSNETFEIHQHARIAADTGADGVAVNVVDLLFPPGFRATVKCKVTGISAGLVPLVDAEWTAQLYRTPLGALTDYDVPAPVVITPSPTVVGVTISYTIAANRLYLQKLNASGTAMTFSGEMVAALAALIA